MNEATLLRWTAFTTVFAALLMPLGVTRASGTASGESRTTPPMRVDDQSSAQDDGDSGPSLDTDKAAI